VAIVVHRGRTSGRCYRTPVIAFRLDDGYAISLPYGAHREWVRNVLAAGSCTLEQGGKRIELTNPGVLVGSEAMAMLPAAVSAALRLLHITRVLRLSTR
jgi:deazaflavin-dependent oxidoreductase (nitroreductase family)